MNILLLTQGATTNIGDIAISMLEKQSLERYGHVVLNRKFFDMQEIIKCKYNSIPARVIRRFPIFIDLCVLLWIKKNIPQNIDVAIIGGGALITEHIGFNSALYMWTKLLSQKGIPIIIYGVSCSANLSLNMMRRYKKAIDKCQYVFVRDDASREAILKFSSKECKCFADVVYSMPTDRNIKKESITLVIPMPYWKHMGNALGVKNEEMYIDYLIDLVKKQDTEKVYFTATEQRDEDVIKKIVECINLKSPRFCQYMPYDGVDAFIDYAQKASVIISARMHGLIIGQLLGCKTIAIPFNDKLKGFEQQNKDIYIKELIENSKNGIKNLIDVLTNIENSK